MSTLHFNWIDWFILGILAFSTIISFFRGFLREVVSLMVWVTGFLLALKLAGPLSYYFRHWVGSPLLRYLIAFFIIFVFILSVGIAINALIHNLLHRTGLGLPDRLLGLLFGAARGVVIASVLLMFFSVGTSADNVAMKQSGLVPYFRPTITWLHSFLPEKIQTVSNWLRHDLASYKSRIHQRSRQN